MISFDNILRFVGGDMKRLTPFVLMAVIIGGFSGIATAEPKLSLPDSIFDFGFVPQNSKISHKFWLHSTGTDSLKIIKVNPG